MTRYVFVTAEHIVFFKATPFGKTDILGAIGFGLLQVCKKDQAVINQTTPAQASISTNRN
jgi:hypothetical protein